VTIVYALLAALCNALNVVTQHAASVASPKRSTGWRFVVYLLHSSLWLAGWIALAGAFIFQALALRAGQLPVVQPLLVTEQVLALVLRRAWQLGNGTRTSTSTSTPVAVTLPAGTTVKAIGFGHGFQSMALTSTDSVLAWGQNNYGQLGNGTTTISTVPVEAHLPAGLTITAITGGDEHALALASTGRLYAWGYNRYGQLGDGSTTNADLPVEVHLPADLRVTVFGAGGYHSMAVSSVTPQETDTTLTATPHEQHQDEPVTLTSRVSCPAGIATGTVTFRTDDTVLGSATLDEDGVATLTLDTLPAGRHAITAHYEGDDTCAPSASEPATVTINPAVEPTPAPTCTATPAPAASPTVSPTRSPGSRCTPSWFPVTG
jgi:hypothetical protein